MEKLVAGWQQQKKRRKTEHKEKKVLMQYLNAVHSVTYLRSCNEVE